MKIIKTLVNLPQERKTTEKRWVYKMKNAAGQIQHFKTLLVVKGFSQKLGLDYHETFSLLFTRI